MISATTEFSGRICYLQLRILCTQILIDYVEEQKRRSDPWFMNKLHYAEITKDSTLKGAQKRKKSATWEEHHQPQKCLLTINILQM